MHTLSLWVHLTCQDNLILLHDLIKGDRWQKQKWCYLKGVVKHRPALMNHLRWVIVFSALLGFRWWPRPWILWFFEVPGSSIWTHGITLSICIGDRTLENLGVAQYLITIFLIKVIFESPLLGIIAKIVWVGFCRFLFFFLWCFCFTLRENAVLKAFQCRCFRWKHKLRHLLWFIKLSRKFCYVKSEWKKLL